VQISDKNLHPSVYSVYYSRGRERVRESERVVPNLKRGRARGGAWVCWSWSWRLERGRAARGEVKCKGRESLYMQRWRERQVINMRKSDVKEKGK